MTDSPHSDPARWKIWVGWMLVIGAWLLIAGSIATGAAGTSAAWSVNPPVPNPVPAKPVPSWVQPAIFVGVAGTTIGPLLGAVVGSAWATGIAVLHQRWFAATILVVAACAPLALQLLLIALVAL